MNIFMRLYIFKLHYILIVSINQANGQNVYASEIFIRAILKRFVNKMT